MDQQVYSGVVNRIGQSDVTLWSIWQNTVLLGVAPHDGVPEKQWLRQGEFIEVDGNRWLLLEMLRAQEPDVPKLMVHLVAVEPGANV